MQLSDLLGLLGGLALFLYGMQMMSSGLEAAAGNRMKNILEKLTANRFMGVLVGAVITAVIQSSSATTVMVVGFVNAGMMTLNQAVWIIMGANVGTTITGMLIALDVGALAPLFAFIGVVLVVFIKNTKVQHIGQILAGLGVLFIGMDMMSGAMSPLRESQFFIDLMSNFSNPILGILFGAAFTAIIQSSSAAVGILQTLSSTGVLPLTSAAFVLFGTNIGTCITALLASIGTNRNARRTTVIHLLFNIIGTVIFTVLILVFPVTGLIESLVSGPKAQIAAMHTTFNIVTTILLLPLGNYLAKLAVKILPELPEEEHKEMYLEFITPVHPTAKENILGSSAIYVEQLEHELNRMLIMARDNVADSYRAVLNRDKSLLEKVEQVEDYLDYLNKEISKHVSNLIAMETNENASAIISSYFTITGNIERVGDHAMNIGGYTGKIVDKEISFSDAAVEEIKQMQEISLEAVDTLLAKNGGDQKWLARIADLEQKIDDMRRQFRRAHLDRMKSGQCSEEACILYAELLTDFERLGDHALNIGEELTAIHELT